MDFKKNLQDFSGLVEWPYTQSISTADHVFRYYILYETDIILQDGHIRANYYQYLPINGEENRIRNSYRLSMVF